MKSLSQCTRLFVCQGLGHYCLFQNRASVWNLSAFVTKVQNEFINPPSNNNLFFSTFHFLCLVLHFTVMLLSFHLTASSFCSPSHHLLVFVSVIIHGHMQTGIFVIVIMYSFSCTEQLQSTDVLLGHGVHSRYDVCIQNVISSSVLDLISCIQRCVLYTQTACHKSFLPSVVELLWDLTVPLQPCGDRGHVCLQLFSEKPPQYSQHPYNVQE